VSNWFTDLVASVFLSKLATALVATVSLVSLSFGALAQQASVEERLANVERLLQTQALADLLGQVEALQHEVQTLRGQLEMQSHDLAQARQRQSELYREIDRRLQNVEGSASRVTVRPIPDTAAAMPGEADTESIPSLAPADAGQAALPIQSIAAAPGPAPQDLPLTGADSEQAPAQDQATVATIAGDPALEKDAYQRAFTLLKEGRYDESIAEFNGFLVAYPHSEYGDNAQYWLGEAYYVTRQFEPAIGEYQKLITAYPQSDKLTHAMLKIGYSYHELGRLDEARAILQDLRAKYPDSTAARLAEDRLQRIALETL
jgi:tol-pal system protein YbgF